MHENVAVHIHSAFTVGVMCAILLPHLTKALVERKKREGDKDCKGYGSVPIQEMAK